VTRGAQAVPLIFVLIVWTLTTHGKFSDSGDEPHYLMVAESLLADRDLDVSNNYRRGDGRWFGASTLEAGPHARQTRTGRLWSTHDIGLPVLILPAYAAATRLSQLVPGSVLTKIRQPRGLFAYSLVSLSMTVLSALGLRLLLVGLSRHVESNHAIAITLAAGLSPPILSHAFLVFPETPAFFVVCAVVWLLSVRSEEVTIRRFILVAIAIGLLPWLHRKYSFFVFGLAFVVLYRHWPAFRSQPAGTRWMFAIAALGPQLALHAWSWYAWGTLGGPQMLTTLPFSVAGLVTGSATPRANPQPR